MRINKGIYGGFLMIAFLSAAEQYEILAENTA